MSDILRCTCGEFAGSSVYYADCPVHNKNFGVLMSDDLAIRNTEYQEWMKNVYQRGDVEFVSRHSHHARNEHFAVLKNDRARGYSDVDLINLADGGVYHFGGRVDRHGDQVIIHVYTD